MNLGSAIFTFFASALICTLPRRYAAIPLLLAAAYVPREAVLEIGPIHFSALHILLLFGACRALARGEGWANGGNSVDRLLLVWAFLLIATTIFHSSDQWVFRCGVVLTQVGSYFLLRAFLQDTGDVIRISKALCLILVPVAILMLLEKTLQHNLFTVLGGYSEVIVRDGHVRARGAFAHPILAGTVGAMCLPIALYLFRRHPLYGLMGLFSAAGIVLASTSSGPVMMSLFSLVGLMFWKLRKRMRAVRWLAFTGLVLLNAVMHDPVYYLMARIDLTGSSQGWFRARLIQSSIEHLNEWWLAGTDYTRHWMPSGVTGNAEQHVDITNHFLGMGVSGGLALMVVFILVLASAFRLAGLGTGKNSSVPVEHRFLVWTLGSVLFGHLVNFFSISLFDQSIVFFYLVLAALGTVQQIRPEYQRQLGAVPSGISPCDLFRPDRA